MIKLNQEYSKELFSEIISHLFGDDVIIFDEEKIVSQKDYWKYITSMHRIGEHSDMELQIYVIEHHRSSDPRVSLTKEIFKTLSDAGHRKALVAIYNPEKSTWRLSLVTMELSFDEKDRTKKTYSNARRFSFLLWVWEKTKTPETFLNKRIKTFTDLLGAFNVEVVRKEFFIHYINLYIRLYREVLKDTEFHERLKSQRIDVVSFTKTLLGKIVFLYFIQKKWWLWVKKGQDWWEWDKNFMRWLWDNRLNITFEKTGNFFNDCLEHLFYNGLNSPSRIHNDDYDFNFQCKIPYLNGGLFKADYDFEQFEAKISNDIFSNIEWTGILDIFDMYNFTIDEDDLHDKEVAVDPEMLGKIFEKMISISSENIGTIVEEFDKNERSWKKQKLDLDNALNLKLGAFYTPREVVHYMCQESLVWYLVQSTKIDEKRIRDLVKRKELSSDGESMEAYYNLPSLQRASIDRDISEIDEKLQKIKILDPAIGSGAFPMGLLHEISWVRWYFRHYWFITDEKTLYNLKKETIEESIYGVDIDPGAIDIARLRFWLSLIVDEEVPEPLPNFEFKFVCADTLVPLAEDEKTTQTAMDLWEKELNLQTLRRYMTDYYNANTEEKKKQLKQRIENYVRLDGAKDIEQLQFGNLSSKRRLQLSKLKPFDVNYSHPFFDSSLMFWEGRGFDIVIWNPPYNVSSNNKGEFIQNLISDYKTGLGEKKINLDDDYIKFIRFGEYLIEKNKRWILAYITNNSFIDWLTHRQMRHHLMKTFEDIFILDLHWSAKKRETTLEGGKDENVFNIMQGVSINIFVKKNNISLTWEQSNIYQLDLYWTRNDKYDKLEKNILSNFQKLSPIEPYYFFVPKNFEGQEKYEEWFKVDLIFGEYNSWIQTKNDDLSVKMLKIDIENVISDFKLQTVDDLRIKYGLKDTSWWNVKDAKNDIIENNWKIIEILYRPFDTRYTYFSGKSWFIGRPRSATARHMVNRDNCGVVITRQLSTFDFWHILISKNYIESWAISLQSKEWWYFFPLYLYSDSDSINNSDCAPNLDPIIWAQINKITWETTPEQVLDYIYAVLHSPSYREKYWEFLKIDFPRVPYPTSKEQFLSLVKLGGELRGLHLLESPKVKEYITTFPIIGSNTVESVKYMDGKVYINASQYFKDVPEIAWTHPIGGYLPAQKWLKDRKGRVLSTEDIAHYQSMIVAMSETDRIMKEVDEVYGLMTEKKV